jgi:hypothetical protein
MNRYLHSFWWVIILYSLSLSCTKKDSDSSTSSGDKATTVPTAPKDLVVTNVDAASVKLTWTDASNNETGFKISRMSYMSGTSTTINVAANATTYTDGGLITYKYRYSVRAYNSIGDSEPSNGVDINVGAPISAPTNLQATVVDSKSISLTWTKNSSDFANFVIERSTTSATADFTQVTTVSSPGYTDTGLTPLKTYWYRVSQTSSNLVVSGYSNVANATTADAVKPPTNLSSTWSGSGYQLSWTASTTANVTYTVTRRTTGYTTGSVIASGVTTTSYSDATATAGLYYYYSVKSVAGGTNSSEYTSECSSAYAYTHNEVERNGPETTLTTLNWCYYRERTTANKEIIIINGNYSGTYAGYNAASYKNYDWDLFELTFDNKDIVKIEVLKGTTTGLWGMGLSLTMDMSATGGESPLSPGNPTISNTTYTWNILYGAASNILHAYLMVSMPDNLINTGPYSYQLKITITRVQ